MKTDWTEEYFSSEPKTFVKLNDSVYLQRRNIRLREKREDESEDIDPSYICESRKISKDVYEALMDTLYTPSQEELSGNQLDTMESIADLYSNQSEMESSQLDIMEAISDIYTLLEGGTI